MFEPSSHAVNGDGERLMRFHTPISGAQLKKVKAKVVPPLKPSLTDNKTHHQTGNRRADHLWVLGGFEGEKMKRTDSFWMLTCSFPWKQRIQLSLLLRSSAPAVIPWSIARHHWIHLMEGVRNWEIPYLSNSYPVLCNCCTFGRLLGCEISIWESTDRNLLPF